MNTSHHRQTAAMGSAMKSQLGGRYVPRHRGAKDSPVNGTSAPVFRLMSDS